MSRSLVIAKREVSSYFYSPIAYIALFIFLAGVGTFFGLVDFVRGKAVDMRWTFECMLFGMVVIIPMLGMGLLSQEWASGTIETMMTASVDETELVLGKFFGLLAFFICLLLPTVFYVLLLRMYGRPDYGPILSAYLGLILVASLFISVTLMFSAMTQFQIVAAVLSFMVLCLLTVLPWAAGWFSAGETINNILAQLVYDRFTSFRDGSIETGNVVFFIASTAVFLFVTVKVLEWNRWK